MPLVDYGSSGESSDEENDTEVVKNEEQSQSQSQSQPQSQAKSAANEEHDEKGDDSTVFSSLPKPKKQMTIYGNVDSLQNLLLNSKTSNSDGTSKRGNVKISIPSLSDFENDDASKPEPKKMKPSTKQAGLFSLLPPPKNRSGKEATLQLIPHVLKTQMTKPKTETFVNNKMKAENNTLTHSSSRVDDEEDDDTATTSYFGEGISNPIPKPTFDYGSESSTMSLTVKNSVQYIQAHNSPSDHMIPYYPQQYYQTAPSMDGQVAEYDNVPVNNEPLELDDRAMQILCGGKRKRNQMPVNIIDLSGEEIMPDSKQWLLKQLTEEQQTRTPGPKKTGGPSVTSRRKHQITYLAFQAKAQELELQNQWSLNRMSRRQTQSKYGF